MHSPIVPWLHNNNLKLIFLGVFGGEEKEFNHQAIPSMCDEMIPLSFVKLLVQEFLMQNYLCDIFIPQASTWIVQHSMLSHSV